MKFRTLKTYLTAGLLAAWGLSGCSQKSPGQASAPVPVKSPAPAADQVILGVLPEALVPVGGVPEASETQALKEAIAAYAQRSRVEPQNLEPLENFIKAHPKSPWVPGLRLNCGLLYHQNGRYTLALSSLREAWALLKDVKEPKGKALGDRAAGELAVTWAYLGRYEELEPWLKEVHGRSWTGPATEFVTAAAEGLHDMKTSPERSFLCGPLALSRVCRLRPKDHGPKVGEMLKNLHSNKRGTSLAQLCTAARGVDLKYQLAFRSPGSETVTPAVVHWKVGHFSCLEEGDAKKQRFRVEDPTYGAFGDKLTITQGTLDEQATGYFLVPPGPLPKGWRAVSLAEGASIWGRGATGPHKDARSTGPDDIKPPKPKFCHGMAQAAAHTMVVGLAIQDTPLGTSPNPFSVPFQLNYGQRELTQPAIFPFTNFGPKWNCNWLSYITSSGATLNADLHNPGGGVETYLFGYFTGHEVAPDTAFSSNSNSRLHKNPSPADSSGPTYERLMPDGSIWYYEVKDQRTSLLSAPNVGARVFLGRVVDPQGNTTSIQYDDQYRIISIKSPTNKLTTLTYGLASDPLKVTKVTDPYGRHADFTYSSQGQLASITDPIGITSQFQYSSNDFISSMTTPYGTSTFQYGDATTDASLGNTRWLTLTDPSGRMTRYESREEAPGIPFSESVVPQGMGVYNAYLNYRNTFVWTPEQLEGGLDYTKATIFHFQHVYWGFATTFDGPVTGTARTLESVKNPLERRVWFNYGNGDTDVGAAFDVSFPLITRMGNVLGDGSTQLTKMDYNLQGNMTSRTDPSGRLYTYTYGSNGVDLTSVQVNGQQLMAASYDGNHNIQSLTSASGGISSFTYNAFGQVASVTNELSQTTSYSYTADGDLTSIQEPLNKVTSFQNDLIGRKVAATDSEGYTVQAEYDNFDRPTKLTFPDATTELLEYNLLDLAATTDRLGRRTTFQRDASRRLTAVNDANGGTTSLGYGASDRPTSLTDPGGRSTQFGFDIESRITSKQYAGGGSESYTYLPCCGLPRTITDALGHSKTLSYNVDNTLKSVAYSGSTPGVTYSYDTILPRVLSMTDGSGQTSYTYGTFGSAGANQVASITGPYGDSASFTWDVAGRPKSQVVNGSAENVTFDDLWRPTSTTNALDTFNMSYLGKTGQVTGVNSTSGPSMAYAYGTNAQDRRLSQIKNLGRSGTALSQFDYTHDAVGQITQLTETVGTASNSTGGGGGDDDDDHEGREHRHHGHDRDHDKDHHNGREDKDHDRFGMVPPFDLRLLNGLLSLAIASLWGSLLWQFARRPRTTTSRLAQVTALGLVSALALNGCIFSGGGTTTTTRTLGFSYDKLGELVGVSLNGTSQEGYVFDKSGNLTSLTTGGTTTNLSYNALNQQTSPAGQVFDAKGQTTTTNGRTYEWDDQGRITAIVMGTQRTELSYDGMSRRTKITEFTNGTVTSKKLYFWLGGSIVCERDGLQTGFPLTKRYFGQGEVRGTTKLYYAQDHLGSIRELVDSAGTVQAEYSYSTYGERTKVSGNLDSDFGYGGLWHHAASGLDLAVYRAYDSANKRWISRDPLGEGADTNLYRYCENSPINAVDPSGLIEITYFSQIKNLSQDPVTRDLYVDVETAATTADVIPKGFRVPPINLLIKLSGKKTREEKEYKPFPPDSCPSLQSTGSSLPLNSKKTVINRFTIPASELFTPKGNPIQSRHFVKIEVIQASPGEMVGDPQAEETIELAPGKTILRAPGPDLNRRNN